MRGVSWKGAIVGTFALTWLGAAPATVVAAPMERGGEEAPEAEEESPGHAVRVGCERVISEIDHQVLEVGDAPDLSVIAKRLRTTLTWVDRCVQSYGRRAKHPGRESADSREYHLNQLESDEFEEKAPEDKEEPGARERKEHPEKERRFKSVQQLKVPRVLNPHDQEREEE
jgi:hypothetical protein